MARELSDVLHYFLDDESIPAKACPVIGAPAHPQDGLRSDLLKSLAKELARRGREASIVQPPTDDDAFEGLGLQGASTPLYTIEGEAPPPLCEEVHRSVAQLASKEGAVVLVPLPTDRRWMPQEAELLGQCWLTSRASDSGRAEFFALAERILELRPNATVGVTILGVDGIQEARAAFDGLDEIFSARFDRSLRSYGLLLDELEIRQGSEPAGRAAKTLEDVAALLCDDLVDASETAPHEDPRLGETRFQ